MRIIEQQGMAYYAIDSFARLSRWDPSILEHGLKYIGHNIKMQIGNHDYPGEISQGGHISEGGEIDVTLIEKPL